MTLRLRLFVSYIVVAGLGMALLSGYLLYSLHNYFLQTARADLANRATGVRDTLRPDLLRHDLLQVQLTVDRNSMARRINVRVIDPTGRLVASSAQRRDKNGSDWSGVPGVQAGLNAHDANGIDHLPGSHTDEMYEVRPVVNDGLVFGVVRMSLRLEQTERKFQQMVRTVAFTLLITLGVCGVLSMWVARSIAGPVLRMRDFAARVGDGYFGERLEMPREDEIGELASELNSMSQRLGASDEERRAFLANVSHELRTPVSNVHVTLEALESGADEEPELRRRFIRTCLDETERLSHLIGDLLDLGRLEAGVVPLKIERLRLRALLARCERAIEIRMLARGLRLEADVPDVRLEADAERLVQALLNILDNAIKHTAPESSIRITGRTEGGWLRLEIRDQGPGIAPEDLPRIFDAFYTADRSRKRGGTGLGLAITRRIITAHGGSITAASTPGHGAVFTVELPLRASTGSPNPQTPRGHPIRNPQSDSPSPNLSSTFPGA